MHSNNPADYTNEELRGEIERGGRLVTYAYCISILVVTFRRRSRVYVIPAGHGSFMPGLPWALVSLLFGWWGFPRGIVFTPVALFQTLSGGIDLTDEWQNTYDQAMREERAARLAAQQRPPFPGEHTPAHSFASHTPPPPANTPQAAPENMPASFRDEPHASMSNRPSPLGKLIRAGSVIGALLFVIYMALGYWAMNTDRTVTLVNGLGTPYIITINDTPYDCPESGATDPVRHIELPSGHYKVRATLPNGEEFFAEVPVGPVNIWNWPGRLHRAILINPDKLALICRVQVIYRARSEKNNAAHAPNPMTFFVNEGVVDIRKPDYYFKESPDTIRIKKGESTSRTQLNVIRDTDPQHTIHIVRKYCSTEETAAYAARAALLHGPAAISTLMNIIGDMKPDEVRNIFAQHLDTRPVNIQWHRYYQQYAEAKLPDLDLVSEYRARLAKNPDDNAFVYLLARILPDHNEARALYEKALAGPLPCAYAWNGLAYEAMREGNRALALDYTDKAAAAATAPRFSQERLDLLMALGRVDDALSFANDWCAQDAAAIEPQHQRALLLGFCRRPTSELTRALLSFTSATAKKMGKDEVAACRDLLEAYCAYGSGEEERFAAAISKITLWPSLAINAHLTQGDHKTAAASLAKIENASSRRWFLAAIVAGMNNDEASAREYFETACGKLAAEGKEARSLATLLKSETPPVIASVRALTPLDADRRVICCALGMRHHEQRKVFFDEAQTANASPDFPRLLLARAMKMPPQS